LRELFNVCWHPAGVVEGQPAAPDVQSMPNGMYGNVFDVLVDRPARLKALADYPVGWAAGDGDLTNPAGGDHRKEGGALVVNVEAAKGLPAERLGVKLTGKTTVAEEWAPDGGEARATTPYEVAGVELAGAKPLVWATKGVPLVTRHALGDGAVVLTL